MAISTWKTDPQSDQWNDEVNWEPGTVPTTAARFGASSRTAITFATDSAATVETIEFAEDADAYSLGIHVLAPEPALTITGAGIINRSETTQSFIVASLGTYNQPQLKFTGSASAGESHISYYAGPQSLETSYGGGTIAFHDAATAGSANFTVRTGKLSPPNRQSTLGGQVTFGDRALAGTATFSIYGTLGTDGDTFGNAVFHDTASADRATFTNHGGTVPGGDGGNTQFYDHASAAQGIYLNHGGTAYGEQLRGANGGDVAFDGCATGGHGRFSNYPASVEGANGGVTSFNNNPNYPAMQNQGASAGCGIYLNYGATAEFPGGGGHTEFTARYGFATAGHATVFNFGSALGDSSGAGHTIFSVNPPNDFFPSAGDGTFWNLPGVAGGYTVFEVYGTGIPNGVPTGANGTFHNLGSAAPGLEGGYTAFKGMASAGDATLIAHGGTGGGQGGRILFSDTSSGGTASIQLTGNGVLDISGHTGGLSTGFLELTQGVIKILLGVEPTGLTVSGRLTLHSAGTALFLSFPEGTTFEPGQEYIVLRAPNLSDFEATQFTANRLGDAAATIRIEGDMLRVSYSDPA